MIPPLKLCGHALLVLYTQLQANSLSVGHMDRWTRKQARPHSQYLYFYLLEPPKDLSSLCGASPEVYGQHLYPPRVHFLLPSVHACRLQTVSSRSGHFSRSTPVAWAGLGKLKEESLGVLSLTSGGMSQLLCAEIMDQKVGFSKEAVLSWGCLLLCSS